MEQINQSSSKTKKVKLNLKIANMRLVGEKDQLPKFGLKKVQGTFM